MIFIEHKSTNCIIIQVENFRITIDTHDNAEDEEGYVEQEDGIDLHIMPRYGVTPMLDETFLNKDFPLYS